MAKAAPLPLLWTLTKPALDWLRPQQAKSGLAGAPGIAVKIPQFPHELLIAANLEIVIARIAESVSIPKAYPEPTFSNCPTQAKTA